MNAQDLVTMSTLKIREIIENSSSVDDEVKNEVMRYFEKEEVFSVEMIGAIRFGMVIGKMMQEKGDSLDVIVPLIDDIFDSND